MPGLALTRVSAGVQAGSGSVLAEDAVVLNALDAGVAGAGDGFIVNDFVLEPEVGDAETNDVVDDSGDELRGAKNVNEVDSLPGLANTRFFKSGGLRSIKVGITGQAGNFGQLGIHGDYAVAVGGEVLADVVAGARGLIAHADNGDGFGGAKHFIDEVLHQFEFYSSQLIVRSQLSINRGQPEIK